MSSLQEVLAIQVLEDALSASEYGIEVQVFYDKPMIGLTQRAKGILYKYKKENPRFRDLVIKFCPYDPDNKLWIYTGDEKLETRSQEPEPNEAMEL